MANESHVPPNKCRLERPGEPPRASAVAPAQVALSSNERSAAMGIPWPIAKPIAADRQGEHSIVGRPSGSSTLFRAGAFRPEDYVNGGPPRPDDCKGTCDLSGEATVVCIPEDDGSGDVPTDQYWEMEPAYLNREGSNYEAILTILLEHYAAEFGVCVIEAMGEALTDALAGGVEACTKLNSGKPCRCLPDQWVWTISAYSVPTGHEARPRKYFIHAVFKGGGHCREPKTKKKK